jgi:hypothetical protein
MNLQLEQYVVCESDKEMRCDATELFWENSDRHEISYTHNETAAIFHARQHKIYPKDKMVYIEVLDADTGELLTFVGRKAMHDLMVKYMLYPPIILNALKQ